MENRESDRPTHVVKMPPERPIPAFYCCYLLRSTVNHSRGLYIGSTPNPVRRLRQHNGLTKGGAARTTRDNLRPWEMGCIVTGFPSQIAALKFEWAWQHPHLTQHIPPESRLSFATQKKRNGQPKTPRHTVKSSLSNLHLLLRVPSFSRWPLDVRFFAEDLHKEWVRLSQAAPEQLRDTLLIILDFPPTEPVTTSGAVNTKNSEEISKEGTPDCGIHALDIDYEKQKQHIMKGRDITIFEQEGSCAVCYNNLEHDEGIYTICPNPTCQAVTHVTCLSKHFLAGDQDSVLPIQGTCPSCKTEHTWVDVVKELSLRMRGQKEVEKLLKKRRSKTTANRRQKPSVISDFDEDTGSELDMSDVTDVADDDIHPAFQDKITGPDIGGVCHEIPDSEDSDCNYVTGTTAKVYTAASPATALPMVIEDSEWDDIDQLD